MSLTMTNAAAALKEFYLPGAREQLNNDIPLLAQLEKNTEDIEGKRAVLSIHTRRNSGVGARAERGVLPAAGQQGYAEERIPLKSNYASGNVSGQTIKAMASDRGSFVRSVDSEMKGMVRDLKRDVNRQAWGTSDAKIATCGVTTAAVVIVLAVTTSTVQLRQLEVGMLIDIGTVANPQLRGTSLVISAVDFVNKTVTVNTAITTAGTDFVFRQGAAGTTAAPANAEITGMQSIASSTGALYNIDPAVEPSWAATLLTNPAGAGTLRSVSENLMASGMQQAQIAGGVYIDLFVASDGVHRAYANLLTSLKRFPQTVNLKGGYSGLDFTAGGPTVPVVWDRDCPSNSLFGIPTEHLQEYQMSDWEFLDDDGNILQRSLDGTDGYQFTLFKYHEQGTDKRNAFLRISDLQEAS